MTRTIEEEEKKQKLKIGYFFHIEYRFDLKEIIFRLHH
jgi:hypothetical protein